MGAARQVATTRTLWYRHAHHRRNGSKRKTPLQFPPGSPATLYRVRCVRPISAPPTASRVAAYATHHAYAQEDVGEDDASPAHRHAAPALFSVTDCPHFPIFCTITYSPDLVPANVIDRYRTRLFGCLLFVRGRGMKPPTLRRQAPYEPLQRSAFLRRCCITDTASCGSSSFAPSAARPS